MNKYYISKSADRDIDKILEYSFLTFGKAAALDYYKSLSECFNIIGENPKIGQKFDHIRKGYFRFIHKQHYIFYKKLKNGIFIIRVLN